MQQQPLTRSRTSLFLSYRESRVGPTPLTPRYLDDDDYDDDLVEAEETAGLIQGADSRSRGSLSTPRLGRGSRARRSKPPSSGAHHLPPQWLDWADKVDDLVLAIKPKSASCFPREAGRGHVLTAPRSVVQLDKLHAKHLLPGFKDRTAEEREIEALATSITAVSTNTRLSSVLAKPAP